MESSSGRFLIVQIAFIALVIDNVIQHFRGNIVTNGLNNCQSTLISAYMFDIKSYTSPESLVFNLFLVFPIFFYFP